MIENKYYIGLKASLLFIVLYVLVILTNHTIVARTETVLNAAVVNVSTSVSDVGSDSNSGSGRCCSGRC